jgi:hypothetical protein
MNWTITYPRKLLSFKNKTVREEEKEAGSDCDTLLDLIEQAYRDGEEIQVNLEGYDPTPNFLYDDTGGEPALSSDERWEIAFNQKREARG